MTQGNKQTLEAIINQGENSYLPLNYEKGANLNAQLIQQEAKKKALEIVVHKKTCYEIKSLSQSIIFWKNIFDYSIVESHITSRWGQTKKILKLNHIAVPEGRIFSLYETALGYFSNRKKTLLFKAEKIRDKQAKNTPINNKEELEKQWLKLYPDNNRLILEDYLEAKMIKVIILGNQVISAYIQIPVSIKGNNKSTLAQLIKKKNALRKKNPRLRTKLIKYAPAFIKPGVDLQSIPQSGEIIPLDSIISKVISDDIVNIKALLHPSILQLAIQSVQSITTLKFAEIKLMADNYFSDINDQNVFVIDINSSPSLSIASFPNFGKAENIASKILTYAFSNNRGIAKDKGFPYCRADIYHEKKSTPAFTKGYDLQMEVIKQAAYKRNLEVKNISHTLYSIKNSQREIIFKHAMTELTPIASRRISNNKSWTKEILKKHHINTPEGSFFTKQDQPKAWDYAKNFAHAMVIKPQSGSGGKGVTTAISTQEHFNLAWQIACDTKGSNINLVEEYIQGNDYRIYVIGGSVVAVTQRLPAHVVGDGVHSIEELMAIKNKGRLSNPHIGGKLLELTAVVIRNLNDLKLSSNTILAKGQLIQLHSVANIGRGGESKDVTDVIHPEFCKIAVKAKQAIFNPLNAGVDIIAEDISKAPDQQRWSVIEINSDAHIALHHFPSHGKPRDASGALINYLFPENKIRNDVISIVINIEEKIKEGNFKQWLWRNALLRGIDGWVKTHENGFVEALFFAPSKTVKDMLSLCREEIGKQQAIKPVEVNLNIIQSIEKPECGFEIRE